MANKFDWKSLSDEQRRELLKKAAACETPEELMALAKEQGLEMTEEQAKNKLEELENLEIDLSDEQLKVAAGGSGRHNGQGLCLSDSDEWFGC